MDLASLKVLIDKIGVVKYKYDQEAKLRGEKFNVFSILKLEHDEVRLHSAFLGELLNREGTHGLGTVFLTLFVEKLSSLLDEELHFHPDTSTVKVEKNIGGLTDEGGRMDIFMFDRRGNAIIIENKIYAGDQYRQLEKYNLLQVGGKKYIFYLTLEGAEPSIESRGKLEVNRDFHLLSYRDFIYQWLDGCYKESASYPLLRETIKQYQFLIQKLTGTTMSKRAYEEIFELLAKEDNAVNAYQIVGNWKHIKWITEFKFWNELENRIVESGFQIPNNQKYSEELLDDVYHNGKLNKSWYGIMFKFDILATEHDVCIYIERGTGGLQYGITLLKEGRREQNSTSSEFNELAGRCAAFFDIGTRKTDWVGRRAPNNPVDFNTFSNKQTLKLANAVERQKYIGELWKEIKSLIDCCQLESNVETSFQIQGK